MKSELNVGYIILFFPIFVKLKCEQDLEQDLQDFQDWQEMSRIYRIFKISKIRVGDCSSGSPDSEQVKSTAASYRSAGACPPRSSNLREKRMSAKAFSPVEARRGTGPRPTVSSTFFPVARGPVPRDRPTCAKNACQPMLFPGRGPARDRPSPYGKRHVFSPERGDLSPYSKSSDTS